MNFDSTGRFCQGLYILLCETSITLFFHIARSTSSDEDFQMNQNLSIIIISHAKIFLHSEKKIEVKMC